MRRPDVTVAVLGGPDRRRTRALLSELAPGLLPGDDVVVVGGHVHDQDLGSPRAWRVVERTKLVRPPARPRVHEVVVVLDARAEPTGPWLDGLLAILEDPAIGACAPRANIAEGEELLVGVPYRPHERAVREAFVSTLATRLGYEATEVNVLSGPCIAVRRDLFVAAGGLRALQEPHPVAALGAAARSAGLRIAVASGSYLHNGGGPPPRPGPRPPDARPLVSACLIVKDERHNLGRCLTSLEGFCDEVVVYDTGSTDDTRELARDAGAVVVEGFWDGDFGRARNAALEHCTGEWVLWIDADEVLVTDGPVQRDALAATSADIEALVVMIDNLREARAATTLAHPACRLFRRAYGCWTGKLHEQVVARAGTPELATAPAEGARITHWGYLAADFESRDKARRNLKSAFSDLSSSSGLSWTSRLVNLARSYGLCGRDEAAIDLARAAIAAGPNPAVERLALRTIIGALVRLDRGEDALAAADELRAISRAPLLAELETGRTLLSLGRDEEALEALSRVGEGVDDDGFEYGAHDTAVLRATALSRLDRHGEAADVLLGTITEHGGLDVHVGTLVGCLEDAGRRLTEIAEAVPTTRAVAFLGQLPQLEPEVADRVLEAWHGVAPSTAVLATATKVAGGLALDRRTVWSSRLRAAGLAHACPLVRLSGAPAEVLAGAALAAHRYGDPRGHMAVAALVQSLSPAERGAVRQEVERHAPSMTPCFDAVAALPSLPSLEPPGALLHQLDEVPTDVDEAPSRTDEVGKVDKKVLVVGATVSIRAMAVAVSLRRCGHDVLLVQPASRGARTFLSSLGVELAEFARSGCETRVAQMCATRSFDVLVVTRLGQATELQRLLPAAALVVDLDDAVASLPRADLVLAMGPGPGLAFFPVSAPQLYPPPGPFPLELREGVCVVGDFEAATPDELAHLEEAVLPALARHLGPTPVAVIGGGDVAGFLPGALDLGALANPVPWLRAARAVLVGSRAGAEHWLAAAQMCGTPGLAVPGADVDQLVPALVALADRRMDALWVRVAPRAATEEPLATPDPLSALATIRRRGAARVRFRPAGARLFETSGSTVADLRWGYGALPSEWLGPIRDLVDEVRVPTAWAREHALSSGVPEAKLHVATGGVDMAEYTPDGPRRMLRTRRQTKLLYLGDCSEHSGVDALVESYFVEFGAREDVCLVVATAVDAEGAPLLSELQGAASTSGHPEVLLVDAGSSALERAALYRACDALVCPERAQGDPTTLLEAMACGLPVVFLGGGAFDELCSDDEGYRVPASEVEVTPEEAGVLAPNGRLWKLEPSRAALSAALRAVVADREGRARKGEAARMRLLKQVLALADI
ncbi:MAG: glycosyltransferase [Acidimicrobiales bacterium]